MESERRGLAVKSWQWLKNGLFPVYCLHCQTEGWKFCEDCQREIFVERAPSCCPFCHKADSEGQTCKNCAAETFLDGCTTLSFYHDPVLRGLLQNWKFNGDEVAGQALTDWLKIFSLNQLFPPVDWYVTSIPLHEAKQRERGFNQAEEIARVLAGEIDSQHLNLLSRIEWTDPQARRAAEERKVGDLDGIFETNGLVPPCVLICDDVLTSGATMDAAAKVLKEAGAQIVWGFTIVRAAE